MTQARTLDLSKARDTLIYRQLVRTMLDESTPFMESDGTAYRVWQFSGSTRPLYIPKDVVGVVAEYAPGPKQEPDVIFMHTDEEAFQSYFAGIQVVSDIECK